MKLERELQEAIHRFGEQAQVIVAIEELAELQKELTKHLRGIGSKVNLAEELADVEIMLSQIKHIYSISDADIIRHKNAKLERLADKLGLRRVNKI